MSDVPVVVNAPRHAMSRAQQAVVFGSAAWAVAVLVVGIATFGVVNDDARLFVGGAILAAAFAAFGASWLAFREHLGWAALALGVSVVAPTFFLWVINVVPLVLAAVALRVRTQLADDQADSQG